MVGRKLVLGPQAAQAPCRLRIPLFVSDMSFGGALMEAKFPGTRVPKSRNRQFAPGKDGMLPEEHGGVHG